MITIDQIITHIKTVTSYTNVVPLAQIQEDLKEIPNLPRISVGYAAISSKNPNTTTEHDLLNQDLENLVQTFIIHIVSTVSDFPTIWQRLAEYSVLTGWNPVSEERCHSGFTYSGGSIIGLEDNIQRWQDYWNIGFPTVTR